MHAWEVWNRLLKKSADALTEAEKSIRQTNIFIVDFEMGGWLYNTSPTLGEGRIWSAHRATANSVREIGAASVAEYLEQIADIVEQVDLQESGSWGAYLAKADPKNKIKELERLISEQVGRLWDKLTEYTGRHFDIEPD